MPQVIIYLDDNENQIVERLSEKLNISKHEAVKKIIRERENIK